MKSITFVMVLACLLSCSTTGPGIEEIELSPFIVQNYMDDARQLYFNEVYSDSTHPDYNNPELDETAIRRNLEMIQAVYNLDIPEKDTVFGMNIHARFCYSFNSIYLNVDASAPEIQKMVDMDIPTGDEKLDNILTTYQFDSVDTFYSYPNFPWLTLYSSGYYNMIPIEKQLKEIPAVNKTEINNGCFDGNEMHLEWLSTSKAILTFGVGMGDCPAGCFFHLNWEFIIENGVARFNRKYQSQG